MHPEPRTTRSLVALVRAAGASTRMGTPKLALEWRGETFLTHALRQARWAGAEEIIVVTGATPLAQSLPAGVRHVDHPGWSQGPLSTLQVGFGSLDPGPCLVLTVDRPHVARSTLEALSKGVSSDPLAIWQPAHAERRGHPIVWPQKVRDELSTLPSDSNPRELLARAEIASLRRSVEVADPAIFQNLDRPEDLARLPA